ncbi:MAG: type II toxin-antitoxin system PemK/MazF family toxin [bacterium]|nr:type II toxin-antitoxin system PemK/MazF family toxin [bacterium]
MTRYKTGDVVLIPFPFTDLTAVKQRPAVVLSSSQFNRKHEDVIVVAITSHLSRKIADDEYLLDAREQKSAGLPITSLIKLGKIVTLEQHLIRKKLGRIPEETRRQLIAILANIFRES